MTDTDKLVKEIAQVVHATFGVRNLRYAHSDDDEYPLSPHVSVVAKVVVESPPIQALIEKANRAEGLEEALRKWPCADCGGTKAIRGVGGLLVECDFCHGTGVHPTARAALLAKEQNQVGDR